jgi:sialate O-acetylesterase
LILAAGLVACHTEMMKVTELKAIPDAAYAKGVSAPFCGVVGDALVVAGGANFPDKSLLDGGAKRVYADIWSQADGEWVHAGVLPDSTAYGATFAVDGALVLAGGNVCGTTTDKVYELTLRDRAAVLRALPPLPVPMEQCGWTRDGDRLYLVGGVGTTGVYACTVGEYVWTKLADLPEPLVQPVAFASGGSLYVWGGFNTETLEVSDKGLVISSEVEKSLWREAPSIPDGGTFVGATGATLPDGRLVVVGGVNRAIFARALHNTPEDRIPYLSKEPAEYQFRQAVYAFDPAAGAWTLLGSDPACALAGPGVAVRPAGGLYVAGGELKPGVRSPRIFSLAW